MRCGVVLLLVFATVWTVAGCGRLGFEVLSDESAPDAGPGPRDAGFDAALADAGRDAGPAPMDAGHDSGRDAGPPPPDAADEDAGCADDDGGCPPPVPPCAVLPAPVNPCLEVPFLGGPPLTDGVLDGMRECGPPLAVITPLDWTSTEPIPPEHQARYTMGYREDGVYIFLEITDADRLPAPPGEQPWRGDSVEVYLDSNGEFPIAPLYDSPGAFQFVIAAPADDVNPSTRASVFLDTIDQGPWTSSRFATFPTPTGYVFEAWFSAADLGLPTWTLLQGGHIGFNFSINVSAPLLDQGVVTTQGTRLGQYFLHIGSPPNCGRPYCSSDAFCTPELK
jgi:hypothetical protein